MRVYLLTRLPLPSYSCGMISEFQELSDKIDQLAEMSLALRRENAELRHANAALAADNAACQRRLAEAHARVSALLEKIPAIEGAAGAAAAAPVPEDVQ
ncbi:hypothetical protein [Massilia sp. Root351]|uniref:hypothetical protein n=1 Tax=Massilia sp. Root351 TaxID=1736522 RepID=UPI0027D8E48C|nr:hypothetical protein [Massilia sp. Root351]